MNITQILALFPKAKRSGKGYSLCCPAHEDHNASLSVSEGHDGRILLHCHAGCATEDILAKLGLTPADLFAEKPASALAVKPRMVATYAYVDENGKLLFEAVRYVPKDFRQRRPDPARPGEWLWNLGEVPRVLYRLPEVLAAVVAGRVVFVVEGEKDVDALVKAGFAATCNPMGAGKWLPEHAAVFRGAARVVVIADKDAPGRKHACAVASSLLGVAKSVRLIELPDRDGKPVKDAADFFNTGGMATELKTLVAATADFVPSPEPDSTPETLAVDADASGWPEPGPLPSALPPVARFDFRCLPDTFRPWLEDIAERMQCPPDFIAVATVVAIGSVIGRKIGIRPQRLTDWIEVPNIWGCIIGRPGFMKSPALGQALAPVRRLEAAAIEKFDAEMREHKASAMIEVQAAKLAEQQIAKLLKGGQNEGAHKAALAKVDGEKVSPVVHRYMVNDSTLAKLSELLKENSNGLLVYRDELIGFLRGLDKEGSEGDRAFYLEAWTGTNDFIVDRIGRGTVRIKAIVSLLGGIQPGVLAEYVKQAVRGGAGDDGLLQRIQVAVYPDASPEWRNVDRGPDIKAKTEAFSVFQYLDELTAETAGADASDGIPFLRFDGPAQERFNAWREGFEKSLRGDSEHPAFVSHLAKFRKLVPALALILHLANQGTGPVTLAALEKALLWESYLRSHARRVYSAALHPAAAAAHDLAKRLQRGSLPSPFTLRELYRKQWTGLSSKEDVEPATEILCDLGWLRMVPAMPSVNGRPPSPAFEINPKIFSTAPARTAKTATTPVPSVLSVPPAVVSESEAMLL